MLKLLKYLDPVIDLFCFPIYFGFFKEVNMLMVIIDTILSPNEINFIQNNHNQTKKISKYLQLTGKNKFIG